LSPYRYIQTTKKRSLVTVVSYDKILLDINLKTSNINGDKFCQMLKSSIQYNSIPIILISAAFSEKEKEEILTVTGADEIIFKPIDRLNDLDVIFKYLKQ